MSGEQTVHIQNLQTGCRRLCRGLVRLLTWLFSRSRSSDSILTQRRVVLGRESSTLCIALPRPRPPIAKVPR